MPENAIVVENLSKRYLIGHRYAPRGYKRYTALRDVIARKFTNFVRKTSDVLRGRQVIQGDEVEEIVDESIGCRRVDESVESAVEVGEVMIPPVDIPQQGDMLFP